MDAPTDRVLWERALGEDSAAFTTLFDRHVRRVHRCAWRLVEHEADAEDVTGAVFLELWRRRADVRVVDESILPWLLVTTANVARNQRRTVRRHRRLLARMPASDLERDVAESVEDSVTSRARRTKIQAALRTLREPDASLVAIVMLEERPLAEAAETLGLTYSAAKSRFHRARHRLQSALRDIEPARERSSHTEGSMG